MPRATGSTSCTRRPIISMGRTRIHNGWGETMRVGFIGLGAMGSRMASRLLAAHHDVVVYNRSPERTRPLEQRGAKVAATSRELAAGVDIVFSSVANDAALEQVMFGPDGALAGTRAEAIALGLKAGLPRERFLEVRGETAVMSPSQKSKLENARKDEYPAAFALRLMFKDFGLILETAMELSVPMPATAAAVQVAAAEHARQLAAHGDEDFSVVVGALEQLAGVGEAWSTPLHTQTEP